MDKNVDPKLRAAIKEIERVMDKYDCGGSVALCSRTHTEFTFHFPRWALLRIINDGKAVHIKFRGKSNPEDTEATMHLLMDTQQVCGNHFMMVNDITKRLADTGIEVDSKPFRER